jgi:hypothetical protein
MLMGRKRGAAKTQIPIRVRQPAAGELEGRIVAQPVEVVAILVAAGDGEDTRTDHVGKAVHDPARVTPVWEHSGQLLSQTEPTIGERQKHHASVRRQPAAVKRRCDLLAANRWKRERQNRIVDHGECGCLGCAQWIGVTNRILRHPSGLRHARQPFKISVMNKSG